MLEDSKQPAPAQEPQPTQSSRKNGMRKAIVIIAVVAIIIIAALAVSLMSSPSIVGKWGLVSEIGTWDWIEFRKDGTGITSDGEGFNWQIASGQLIIIDVYTFTLDYSLSSRELILDIAPLIWADVAAAAAAAGIEGGIGGASDGINRDSPILATYHRI